MAFNGSLIRLNGTEFPHKYIKTETYKVTPARRQDLDSFVDNTGVLNRFVLDHTRTSIQFSVISMWGRDHDTMMGIINGAYTDFKARQVPITYYDTESCSYKSGTFYLDSNIEFPFHWLDPDMTDIFYDETEFIFTEY